MCLQVSLPLFTKIRWPRGVRTYLLLFLKPRLTQRQWDGKICTQYKDKICLSRCWNRRTVLRSTQFKVLFQAKFKLQLQKEFLYQVVLITLVGVISSTGILSKREQYVLVYTILDQSNIWLILLTAVPIGIRRKRMCGVSQLKVSIHWCSER